MLLLYTFPFPVSFMNRYLRNAIYKKNDIPYSLKKTDSNWDGFETKELCCKIGEMLHTFNETASLRFISSELR